MTHGNSPKLSPCVSRAPRMMKRAAESVEQNIEGEQMAAKSQNRKKNNKRPNILVIWGDDIGITNLSCYSDGIMGYRTPNIDRIADEGMRFTDAYGEQSCTAGRASFITGQ